MASLTRRSTPEDKGLKVNVVCWLLVALSAVFIGLRLFCKFKTHRGLWWDDHVLTVAWVCHSPSSLSTPTHLRQLITSPP